jgi:hypothetical protein
VAPIEIVVVSASDCLTAIAMINLRAIVVVSEIVTMRAL